MPVLPLRQTDNANKWGEIKMKTTRFFSLIASSALILALTGCQGTSTSSVPTVDFGSNSYEESSDGSSVESSSAENSSAGNSSEQSSSPESSVNSSSSTQTSRPEVPPNDDPGVISGSVLVCPDGRGMPLFGGGTGTTYAASVNAVKEKVGADVNVFSMIVPTQGSFYMPKGFTMADEWNYIENVNAQLYGIIPVDAYTALSKHTDEEIYARTDHHWMQLGAYYAAEQFVKTAKISVPFAPISDYERHDMPGYLGTLYKFSEQNPTMAKNPETFVYYIPPNDFTTYYMNPADSDFARGSMFLNMNIGYAYGTFMGGDEKVVHVETDVKNGRKLLIIKDSYPNALVPCLTGSFEEIWTADMRFLEEMQHFPNSISEAVKKYGITDVLFCMNTFSSVSNAYHLPGII